MDEQVTFDYLKYRHYGQSPSDIDDCNWLPAVYWLNDQGQLHRLDGPAVEYDDGTRMWYVDGQLHRENGPAIINSDGEQQYFYQGQAHREHGPALITDHLQAWYTHGQIEKIVWADGSIETYNRKK